MDESSNIFNDIEKNYEIKKIATISIYCILLKDYTPN